MVAVQAESFADATSRWRCARSRCPPGWYRIALNAGTAFVFVHWLIVADLCDIHAPYPYCPVVWIVTVPIFGYTTVDTLPALAPLHRLPGCWSNLPWRCRDDRVPGADHPTSVASSPVERSRSSRARATRERMVPTGQPATSAASA